MRDALAWSFDVIANINWLEIIKTLPSIATAVIAFFALRNWQRQDKAKREAEFLDALIEAVHTYVVEISRPVTLMAMAKISMTCHAPIWEDGADADKAIKGAIAYIQANGERDANRLMEALEVVRSSSIKLRSLGAKGQVFKFNGYTKCQNVIAMLTWQFDRMQAFVTIIGSPTWNWDHPEVRQSLKNIMTIDPEDVRKRLNESNAAALEFVRDTYARLYG